MKRFAWVLVVGVLLQTNFAWSKRRNAISAFYKNPYKEMMRMPKKKGVAKSPFSAEDIATGKYIDNKLQSRDFGTFQAPVARFAETDPSSYLALLDESDFVGKQKVTTLEEMEERGLLSAKLDEQPWSGGYWPLYAGNIGQRYGSSEFTAVSNEFVSYFDYVSNKAVFFDILKSDREDAIDALSPSEKYDILLGTVSARNRMGVLTSTVWRDASRYQNSNGSVGQWMGICHGWAVAAFRMPRPANAVEVGHTGYPINKLKFYPDDIKGLASYLWANNRAEVQFLGSRCNLKETERDPDSGHIINPECFDVNPASWHLAITNQIGVAKKSFIMDATFDFQVWNQPVISYKITYFNPVSEKRVDQWKKALVNYEDFKAKDPFKKFRANVKQLVGVEMEVKYLAETRPRQSETDSPDEDLITTVLYRYDLELDDNLAVTGGEWYQAAHPDFLWYPKPSAKPLADGEPGMGPVGLAWDPRAEKLPNFWREIAARAAAVGQVSNFVVNGLVDAAK